MNRLLGIDWDNGELRVVEATRQGAGFVLRQARSWPEPLMLTPTTADEMGKRLRERLQEAGIAPGPAIYCVGRDRVIVRDVRYPDVPAQEVAAIIHFQTLKELNFPADEAVLDYATCSIPWATGEKRAHAFVIRKEALSTIRALCQAAGLRLEAISPRPLGLCDQASGDATAILVPVNGSAELSVVRKGELLFSRRLSFACASGFNSPTLPLKPDAQAKDYPLAGFVPEIRRSLAAYSGQFPQHPVQALLIAGQDNGSIAALESAFAGPVRSYQSRVNGDGKDADAGVLGLVRAKLMHQRVPIDFLAPKEPRPPDNRPKRYAIIAAAVAAAILLGAGALYGFALKSRNDQIAELTLQKTMQDKEIKAFGDLDERYGAIKKWDDSEIVVLDELYDLIARFPEQSGIRVEEVRWSPATQEIRGAAGVQTPVKSASKPATKPIGKLTIVTKSGSADKLRGLKQALQGIGHWNLESWDDLSKPAQATAVLKVFRQEPKEYQTTLGTLTHTTATQTRERDTRRGRGGRTFPRREQP